MGAEVGVEGVLLVHASAEEIETEPAPMFALLADVSEGGGGECLSAVLGVDELGIAANRAYGTHAQDGGPELIDKGADVAAEAAMMRVPVAIETTETSGGLRLVDGGVAPDTGMAAGELEGEGCQLLGEVRVKQAGSGRAAAVMNEAGDGLDSGPLHVCERLVEDVERAGEVRAFPMEPVAEFLYADVPDEVEIAAAVEMSAALELIEPVVLDTVDGTFHAAPELKAIAAMLQICHPRCVLFRPVVRMVGHGPEVGRGR